MALRRKILFVASELTPLAKVGGLGDVIGSLPKALAAQGLDVTVAIPRYEMIPRAHLQRISEISVPLAAGREHVIVYRTVLPGSSVTVLCFENKKYLSTGPIYFNPSAFAGSFKELQRFLFLSKAVYELIARGGLTPDVVHCHDWHAGALITLLKGSGVKTVFTIHNLANQGIWKTAAIDAWFGDNGFQARGRNYNFMAEGIRNADIVTTVSPTYAKEILTPQYGDGLQGLLKQRAKKGELIGILNGIDYSFWNTKSFYTKPTHAQPVFALISRLTQQKGLSLLLPLVDRFVKKYGAVFHFLGQGEPRFEKALRTLARKHPRQVWVTIGFNETLAHQWYGDADFFLMPSLFEPCGLGQMIAMRYGTVPIVRKTGGLQDSVIDEKTGFAFSGETSAALRSAMERAIAVFKDGRKLQAMRYQCLRANFHWQHSAERYQRVYKKL